jgi:UDP-N-acetylmuramoylalanine--D-glutamate ligase
VGLARSGVAAALALRARGETVVAVDAGTGVRAYGLADAGVELHLGADGLALLERVNAVIKSPGVPALAPVIATAAERGLPVLGELELAWRMLPNEFIAVTGTNGKTTTVELVGHIHRQAGTPSAVAGNVGVPVSSLVGSAGAEATVICEASSFQLEDTVEFAPQAAVLLNLSEDHLDRHQTMAAYRAAKLQVFARQRSGDIAVVPTSLFPAGEQHDGAEPLARLRSRRVSFGRQAGSTMQARGRELWWEELPLLPISELLLRGEHNVENAMAAAAVSLARGIDSDAVRAGLRSFRGVPHRLEEVARREGVLYINDSKATNVTSTLVALKAFGAEGAGSTAPAPPTGSPGPRPKAIHLIIGGQGKDQDFTALRAPVERNCAGVYLIGEDASLIACALRSARAQLRACHDLERAVAEATRVAGPGDVVLLSPACASFDQFADFEARGERFRELVKGRRARYGR